MSIHTIKTADESGDELPEGLHKLVQIPKSAGAGVFWIGKYPVTNVQYARFLKADDFADQEFWEGFPSFDKECQPTPKDWGEEGWKWLKMELKDKTLSPDGKRVFPRYWEDTEFGISRPTAPVVAVCWYEANAYSKWLQRHWVELEEAQENQQLEAGSLSIRLPTEIEWVAAAGGDKPHERYPWDKQGEVTQDIADITRRANIEESRIGHTTPVDAYPLGVSPHGVWDLSGNMWEWQANCRSRLFKGLTLRGGSWRSLHKLAHLSARIGNSPGSRVDGYGFRVFVLPSRF